MRKLRTTLHISFLFMLVRQIIDQPSGLTHNYLPNSTLQLGIHLFIFIGPLVKNGILGNENYKTSAVLRKIMVWKKFIYFLKKNDLSSD